MLQTSSRGHIPDQGKNDDQGDEKESSDGGVPWLPSSAPSTTFFPEGNDESRTDDSAP